MPTATKKDVAKAARKTKSLFERAAAAAEQEKKLAIENEAERVPKYKDLSKALEGVRHELHMGRLRIKRKSFAIRVRERQLQELPKEIKEIERARAEEVAKVQTMEQQEAAAVDEMNKIRHGIEERLKRQGKIHNLPLAG